MCFTTFCTAYNQTGQSVRRSVSLPFYFLYGMCQQVGHSMSFARLLFHVSSKKHCFSCRLLKINDLHFQRLITVWQWVENTIAYDLFLHSNLSELFKVFSLETAANSEEARKPTKTDLVSFGFLVQPSAVGCACTTAMHHSKIWTRKGIAREYLFSPVLNMIVLSGENLFSLHS